MVVKRTAVFLAILAAAASAWMVAASAAPSDTVLDISLSTDGTCAPIGVDTIYVDPGAEITVCHHMTNNTAVELNFHTLESNVFGIMLDEEIFVLDPGETNTEQESDTIVPKFVVEANWLAFDQGNTGYSADAVATVLKCPSGVLFVDNTANGANDGSSWSDAFTDLQDGLGVAASCSAVTEVRVAAGTYLPDRGTGDRFIPFVLPDGITVTGGYANGGSSQPNTAIYETILSGDLAGNDNNNIIYTEPTRSDNSTTVLLLADGATATITGVTVSDGNRTGLDDPSPIDTHPIGIGGHLTMDNMVIEDNASRSAVISHRPNLVLTSSIVRNNHSSFDRVLQGTSVLSRTTTVISTLFDGNHGRFGSGVSLRTGSIVNSTFINSTSDSHGAAIRVELNGATGTIINSTIAGNSSASDGGGIYIDDNADSVTITNSIIYTNGPNNIYIEPGGPTPTVTYSIIGGGFTGTGNSSLNPQFVDPINGDFSTQISSPAINAGNNAALPADTTDLDNDGNTTEPLPHDIEGNNRIGNGTIDIGAHEQPSDGLTIFADPKLCYDSRSPGEAGTFDGQEVRTIVVSSNFDCVPVGASSVIFTVSSIDPLTEGNLRMTPAGVVATGGAGVVNYGGNNGLNNTNTVTVPIALTGGAGGAAGVDIQANAGVVPGTTTPITDPTTDVRLMAVGYYSPDVAPDTKFFPLNPCAVADSRTNKGADNNFDGPADNGYWPVNAAFPDIDLVSSFPAGQGGGNTNCGVPTGADAVLINVVTIAPIGGSGFLSVGTGGQNPGVEAVTSFAPLTPVVAGGFNNGATTIVPLNGGQTISLDIDGANALAQTRIRVEVLGYYDTNSEGLDFTPVPPCAAFDSRPNKGASGSFAGERKHGVSHTTTYQIAGDSLPVTQGGVVPPLGSTEGTCEVPDGASAVLINLEGVNALQEGNFWVAAATPGAGADTTGGVLNFNNVTPKMNNANTVVVPLSADGKIDLEINAGSFTADGTPITQARGVILGFYN